MFLINAAMEKIPIDTAALIVVLGMAVVFFGLILLMFVTKIAGAIINRKNTAAPAAALAAASAAPATSWARTSTASTASFGPPCSWPSLQTGLASPSTSFASSPSAKSKTDRCF